MAYGASQAEVVNRALTKLGAGRITSITDNNNRAIVMNSLWETVRKAELARRRWGFSIKRDSLAALAGTPAWGYAKAYQFPADYLSLVQVNDFFVDPNFMDYVNQDNAAWVVEGTQILTDFSAPLKVRYVRDVTDVSSWHPLFVEAVAMKLAYEAAEELTQSSSKQQAALDAYNTALREGVRVAAIELAPRSQADGSWMLGRL